MKKPLGYIAGLAFIFVIGCSHTATVSDPEDIKVYGTDPLSHTVYTGSDSSFHYFVWQNGKSGGRWKVPKATLNWKREVPKGEGRQFVIKDAEGNLQPMLLKKANQ